MMQKILESELEDLSFSAEQALSHAKDGDYKEVHKRFLQAKNSLDTIQSLLDSITLLGGMD